MPEDRSRHRHQRVSKKVGTSGNIQREAPTHVLLYMKTPPATYARPPAGTVIAWFWGGGGRATPRYSRSLPADVARPPYPAAPGPVSYRVLPPLPPPTPLPAEGPFAPAAPGARARTLKHGAGRRQEAAQPQQRPLPDVLLRRVDVQRAAPAVAVGRVLSDVVGEPAGLHYDLGARPDRRKQGEEGGRRGPRVVKDQR